MPSKSNEGASRGLCIHTVLECFINKRHEKHFNAYKDGSETPAVKRLIEKLAKKYEVFSEENIEIINSMISVACKYDFFGLSNGEPKEIISEKEFSIDLGNFIINGFIDKTIVYEDFIKVIDYKSSKAKFSTEELESNIQGMLYSLAIYKLYKKIPNVEFLFLKFARNPFQKFGKCTEEQLKGFEYFLENLAEYLSSFDTTKAEKGFAANDPKKRWQCGKEGFKPCGKAHYICEYRNRVEYFALLDDNGKVVKTSFKKEEIKEKGKIVKQYYMGCPAHTKDDFLD